MDSKFLEGVAGKLGESWVASLLTPAFMFWAGGVLAAIATTDGFLWKYLPRRGREPVESRLRQPETWSFGRLENWISGRSNLELIMVALGGFLLIVFSGVLARALAYRVIRLLEGYWPWPFGRFCRWLRTWRRSQAEAKAAEFNRLNRLSPEARTGDRFRELINELKLVPMTLVDRDGRREWLPADATYFMPTAIGNVLSASEASPREKYGLDPIVCWHPLWLVLPEDVRTQLGSTRTALDNAAVAFLWSACFVVWAVFTWWVLVVWVLALVLAYGNALGAARVYARVLEGAFDGHRTRLYGALRWPLPSNPLEERVTGQQVTRYLWYGRLRADPTFVGAEPICDSVSADAHGNRAVAYRFFHDVMNGAAPASLVDLTSPEVLVHDARHPGLCQGREALERLTQRYDGAFQNLRYAVEATVAERDLVTVRWAATGYHDRPYQGRAAFGRPVKIAGASVLRIVEGRIREMWIFADEQSLLTQIAKPDALASDSGDEVRRTMNVSL